MSTLLSIIVPVYNTAPYLNEAMTSLCTQVAPNDRNVEIEIICVDDGSTDNSLTVLKEWAQRDTRVKVYHQKNQGQSVARNEALRHAHGEWIYFFDSDDILRPDALLNAYWQALHWQADIVMFGAHMIAEDGTTIENERYYRHHDLVELCRDSVATGDEVMQALLRTFTFRAVPWLYLVRASFLRDSAISFYPGIIHEDELFTASLILSAKRITIMSDKMVLHRMRGDSTMGHKFSRRNMDCYLTVVEQMEIWAKKHPEHSKMAKAYLRYTLTHVLITARCLLLLDRLHTLNHIIRHCYLPYVENKRLLQFIAGKS